MKMLIVDDHPIERKTISYLVKSSDLNIETITKANGLQALEYLKNSKIDILFTDIKMPYMDGLELIENALNLQGNIKVIIFSGYGEFDYAKKAISMGVNAYLLKPMVKSEFFDCLNNVINEIIDETNIEYYAAEKTVIDIIYDRYNAHNEFGKVIFSDIWGNNSRYSMVLIRNNIPLSYEKYVLAKGILKEMFNLIIPIAHDELLIILVNEECEDKDSELQLKASKFIIDKFRPEFKNAAVIFSSFFTDITCCKEYHSNIQLLFSVHGTISSIAMYKPIIPYCDTEYTMSYVSLIKLFYESNIEYLKNSNKVSSKQILTSSLDLIGAVPKSMYKSLLKEYTNLIYVCNVIDEDTARAIEEETLASDDLQQIRNFITDSISNIDEEEVNNEIIEKSLNNIKSYIRRHLHEDLSLTNLANMVNYSPNYLCGLFSSNSNMTITQYITQKRMDKAKDLLSGTNMKVKDIAEKVGYSNTSYFIKIFKNFTGLTPKEYKGNV